MREKSKIKENPLVSIIAVCYNHSKFIVECLENIRKQTYKNTELIIIDDCSKDDSVDVIKSWIARNAVKCVFIEHSENMGICKTLNDALSHATGEYIAITATDDVWLPNKIEDHVGILESSPKDVGVVYSHAFAIDEESNIIPDKIFGGSLGGNFEGDLFSSLVSVGFIPAMATLVRKSCYDRVGLYDEDLCYEDWDMWLRISQHYKFAFSPNITTKHRILSTSMTATVIKTKNAEKLKTNFKILSKCLLSDKVDSDTSKRIIEEFIQISEEMYEIGFKERNGYLWKTLIKARNFHMLYMFIFSFCRIPYRKYENVGSWLYSLKKRWLLRQLAATISKGDTYILVDENQFVSEVISGGRAIRLIERDGEYWGNPEDDNDAIQEVERLRQSGANFLVFTWIAFWWFDFYPELNRYLRSRYRCLHDNKYLIIFDLRKELQSATNLTGRYKKRLESDLS